MISIQRSIKGEEFCAILTVRELRWGRKNITFIITSMQDLMLKVKILFIQGMQIDTPNSILIHQESENERNKTKSLKIDPIKYKV